MARSTTDIAKSGDNSSSKAVELAIRIENLLAEKKAAMDEFRESIADLYLEAKGAGCDIKALRAAIADRARERKRDEMDSATRHAIEAYRAALERWAPGGDL